jgi:hypothetical protein
MTYSNSRFLLDSVTSANAVGIGVSGMIAGVTSAVLTNPLDVLKTRKQTAKTSNPGLMELAKQLYNAEGAMGFFRGGGARAVAMGLNSTLMILSYEFVKKYAEKKS